MAQNKTLELSIKIAGRVDKSLVTAINQSNSLFGNLSTTMSRVGTAGLAAMGAMATGTVAALVQCTNAAQEFEKNMAPVVRYVDGLADSMGKVSDATADNGKSFKENYSAMKTYILDLSTEIPRTAEQLATMSASLGQSGIGVDKQLNTGILRDTAMAATAMDLDDQTAGNYMAKWEAAFNFNHEQVMELMDQINYLGANNATTAGEIAQSVNRAASMGQIAGVDPKVTAALATAMQATGVSTERVGTSINRIYTNLSKGTSATKAQKKMWEELGFTAKDIAKGMQSDGVGTLQQVFAAIDNMPDERKVAALSTLFGQWAIEGGAKVVNNLGVFQKTLGEVQNSALYNGSMEKEFIIEASTGDAIDQMLANTKRALAVEMGDAFLPVKKQFAVMMIDTINGIRKNMPELEAVGESLATVLSNGVTALGDAMQRALPHIKSGLDYLANNGQQVANVLKTMAAVFVGMKFAPGIEGLLTGAGGLLMGTPGDGGGKRSGGLLGGISGLFKKGQSAGNAAGGFLSTFGGAAKGNGFFNTLGATASSLISGNGIKGTTGLLQSAAGTPGLLSGYQSAGSTLRNAVGGSRAGQYLGGIGSSLGNLGGVLGNTKIGGAISSAVGNVTLPIRTRMAGVGAAATINGSILRQGTSGLLGKAGGVLGGLARSGPVQAIGGVLGSMGGVAKAGAGVLGSVWGPVAAGFGSIVAGAAPVIGVISSIIAVVSILGDNLDGIRNIIGNVFGDQGVAVFDGFIERLQGIGDFISGLFADGGVAAALAPLRETITGLFGDNAGAAFDGMTQILQSVMGVVGQIVSFATTTVKPIILDIFTFLTGTVLPVILNMFTAAAPIISGIISNIGSAVMLVMQYIGQAIQAVLPIIQNIISVVMSIASVVVPAVLAGIQTLTSGIVPIIEGIKTVFDGLINFIAGVFTGNWSLAWEGVKQIFGGAFDALVGLLKTPVNAVIALINKAISGINGLGLDIPDWVPLIGGKKFSINIPEIPMLAKGGFTNGVSIAGEAGREAVISFQSGVRAKNIETWTQAGHLLGVDGNQAARAAGLKALDFTGNKPVELKDIDTGGNEGWGGGGLTFAPQVIIQGNADRDVIDEALREAQARFEMWYEQMERRRARTAY